MLGFLTFQKTHSEILLAEFLTLGIESQGQMSIFWCFKIQALLQIDLPGCRIKQICATHNMADSLILVVHHHGQLVGEESIPAAHHKVTHLCRQILGVLTNNLIIKTDMGTVDPQSCRAVLVGQLKLRAVTVIDAAKAL